ncbi:hypothetical protein OAP77_01645 [Planctomycetota bacterium]|nr:hypothetical protein [Planctomycetota bacterium]
MINRVLKQVRTLNITSGPPRKSSKKPTPWANHNGHFLVNSLDKPGEKTMQRE